MQILHNKMGSFDRKIKWRDRIEIAACVIVAGVFAFYFYVNESVWTEIGCIIIILAAIAVGYKLIKARRSKSSNGFDHPFLKHLHVELEKVKKQKNLLENIFWWYLLPLYAGLVFFTIGLGVNIYFKVGYLVAAAFVFVFIWRLNKNKAKTYLKPLIRQIKQAINSSEQEL